MKLRTVLSRLSIFLLATLAAMVASVATAGADKNANPRQSSSGTPKSLKELQDDFLKLKFGMFIHFNIATFNNRQWATGTEDPATFAPANLDCGQWLDAAKAAGINYAVLTVKHTGGWCLWDSKYTEAHDIRSFRNFRNGQGDLVREFVDACRQRATCRRRKFATPSGSVGFGRPARTRAP